MLESIIAEDLVGVDPRGNLYDKKTIIANTREAPRYFASNELGKVTVRSFSTTVVARDANVEDAN